MISTESVSTMNAEGETIVVESDGTMRAFMPGEEGIEITNSGAKRIDMVVTGSATYETGTVPELRLNVRQTRDGEISGKGVVTFYSFISLKEHTTEFVATCINPISGWGRTNYGVTMELAEPYFPFNNGVSYRYAVVSITEEGDLDPIQLLRNTDGCGGSISLFGGPDLETGNIQVLALGQ